MSNSCNYLLNVCNTCQTFIITCINKLLLFFKTTEQLNGWGVNRVFQSGDNFPLGEKHCLETLFRNIV